MLMLFQASQRRTGDGGQPRVLALFNVERKRAAPPPAPPNPAKPPPQLRTRAAPPPPRAPAAPDVPEVSAAAPAPLEAEPFALPVPSAGRAPQDSDLMHNARQAARKDDRDDRKGKLASLGKPDTPFAKMKAALAGAYTGGPVSMSSYTSPDGVVISRIERNGTAKCYMAATAGGIPSAVNASGTIGATSAARVVNCPPADAGWRRQ